MSQKTHTGLPAYKIVSLERLLDTTEKGLFKESESRGNLMFVIVRQLAYCDTLIGQVTRTSTSIPANASAAPR